MQSHSSGHFQRSWKGTWHVVREDGGVLWADDWADAQYKARYYAKEYGLKCKVQKGRFVYDQKP